MGSDTFSHVLSYDIVHGLIPLSNVTSNEGPTFLRVPATRPDQMANLHVALRYSVLLFLTLSQKNVKVLKPVGQDVKKSKIPLQPEA